MLVPARLASTRLPGKPLADIAGLPMVVRVAERARARRRRASSSPPTMPTSSPPAARTACEAIATRADHATGSDRLAEACALLGLDGDDSVVNVQGDEPLIDPALIDACAALLDARADCVMATAAHPVEGAELRRPERGQGGARRARPGALLLARADPLVARRHAGRQPPRRRWRRRATRRCATSASTPTAPASCAASRRCRPARWSASSRSSSCACSGTANASRCTSPPARPGRASTRPKTWRACARIAAADAGPARPSPPAAGRSAPRRPRTRGCVLSFPPPAPAHRPAVPVRRRRARRTHHGDRR